jgi:hypothetical protein
MVRHNNESARRTIKPDPEQVMGSMQASMHVPAVRGGLYYRSDVNHDMATIEGRLLLGEDDATVLDFQDYVESAWKTRQGSRESVERFSGKIDEEIIEYHEALSDLLGRQTPTQEAIKEAELELGDLVWCTTALASNGGAPIDVGLKTLLFRYVCGTQWIVDEVEVLPVWRQTAHELSGKFHPISIAEIDGLIDVGFEPAPSPVMNIFDPEAPEQTIDQHLLNMVMALSSAKLIAGHQYSTGETVVMGGRFDNLALELGELAARVFLEAAYINSNTTHSGLISVIGKNVAKISDRVAKNHVDKADRA